MVRHLGAVAALAAALLAPFAGAAAPARFDATPPADCPAEPVPASRSVAGVTDAGQNVDLDVLVLLDGIPPARGRETMREAAASYAPLKVTLRPVRFREVRIAADGTSGGRPSGEIGRLMAETIRLAGGRRPAGSDAVLLLTDKALWIPGPNGERQYGFSGQAECIGGIRWPERAFAIAAGSSGRDGRTQAAAALTAVHELGHLLGADHHHANCVEGPPPRLCTVMLPADYERLGVNSARFGSAEAAIVRGHALDHA